MGFIVAAFILCISAGFVFEVCVGICGVLGCFDVGFSVCIWLAVVLGLIVFLSLCLWVSYWVFKRKFCVVLVC